MAGEIIRDEGICLDIRPWSRTSHVVTWLTRTGRLGTVVKGAVRPKSPFLGQYDLNYTCEILYYARARGDLHALRECVPVALRETLRGHYRAVALSGYCRWLVSEYAPGGPDAAVWYELLGSTLDTLARAPASLLIELLRFELRVLELLGLRPDVEAESGAFALRGERTIPISREVASFLKNPREMPENSQIPLDSARVIGVFYTYHLDCAPDVRRTILKMLV